LTSTSFWQADAQLEPTTKPLRGNRQTDIAIIGAGVTGTAAAFWLARAGANVCILEARNVAAAASGRNGGFLATGTTEAYASAVKRHGHERARRMWAFTLTNQEYALNFIRELEDQGWRCYFRRNGTYKLAYSEDELPKILESAKLLTADGWETPVIKREDLPPRLRNIYFGGAFYPSNGEMHPVRYVTGLARLAQQAGATLHEESPVTAIDIQDNGVLLTTPQGTLFAQKVLLATNAWLPEVGKLLGADWLSNCIAPTRGQVLVTEPVREEITPHPCSSDEGYQYWRQLPDGRLLIGGWRNRSFETEANTYDESIYDGIQSHLEAFVHETLGLPEVGIAYRWAGIMGFTPDSLPLAGQLPGVPHCYICGGYTGHGNAFAIHAAKLVSDLMLGKENRDAELFEPGRFV
jgi:glycine/D-amino acid oxidase-like deaminating enzyme